MRKDWIKLILALIVLILLDIAKPMKYSLNVEFIFLGVIFTAMNCPPAFAFPAAAGCGYFKDCASWKGQSFSFIEFILLSLVIRYIIQRVRGNRLARIFTIVGAITAHIIVNSYYYGIFSGMFIIYFMFYSSIMYLLLSYLLKKWINSFSSEYI